MKKILCGLITVIMLTSSLSVSASTYFSDVKQGDWYYETVTEMTEKGLFEGKGNNLFCPDDTMTRAEFITVVLRIVFPDKSLSPLPGEPWWKPAYDLAVDRNIIYNTTYECSEQVFNAPMPRQEMANIILDVCRRMGVFQKGEKRYYNIPDYEEIRTEYRYAVSVVYAHGFLTGIDNEGTFAPYKNLTRAEASTVLHRVIKAIEENPVEPITIYEGQARYNRNAREGDLFIKANGEQIVLKKGPNGILGEGQGVAPDVGLLGQVKENGCDSFTYKVADYGSWTDSTGMRLQNETYWINETTGEGYWSAELRKLEKKYPASDRDENPGSYKGQVSSDPYSLYVWDGSDWELNFTRG